MDHPWQVRGPALDESGREVSVGTPYEVPQIRFEWDEGPALEQVLTREWLITNGLGSYGSGTLAWCPTRKYHGLFIPAIPGEKGRTVLLARIAEEVQVEGKWHRLDLEEHPDGTMVGDGLRFMRLFVLDGLIPTWEYQVGPVRLRRRLVFVHGENTLFCCYRHLSGPPARMRLRPYPNHRPHDHPVQVTPPPPLVTIHGTKMTIAADARATPMKVKLYSRCEAPFIALEATSPVLRYRIEQHRGYESEEVQRSPGYFQCELGPDDPLSIGVTTGEWEMLDREPNPTCDLEHEREWRLLEKAPPGVRTGTGARLVLAADQFVIEPFIRPNDEAWARAAGLDARSVIAGYHWFTDWGRDTMISLEGLTLSTGRLRTAAAILRTFRHYVRDGLLPNLFPEGGREGLYHTADATLWFFHAIERYRAVTGDEGLIREMWSTLDDIIEHHLRGTRFNIGIDPSDGLFRQGEEGYQLTWMDAKVHGWVVTPRRGKAVELNALWFNALRLMAEWAERLGKSGGEYAHHAERNQAAFNARFWNPETGCLYDVVDGENGDDPAIRPNQVLAISLEHPVLRRDRWEPVLDVVARELLTPVGLRTLAAAHPDYKAKYDGDLRARDAAYHQGTVWPWLLGHYIEAIFKRGCTREQGRALLEGLVANLTDAGIGTISEIFDASPPYRPRGCIAQAWSIAEMLRSWLRTQ